MTNDVGATLPAFPITTVYFIYASTGCSCCNHEDHYRGPWKSREAAQTIVPRYQASRLLASQYARNGRYTIEERQAELLPDGRLIVDDRVIPSVLEDDDYGHEIYRDL